MIVRLPLTRITTIIAAVMVAALASACGSGGASGGGASGSNGPQEAVVQKYLDASKTDKVDDLVKIMHPDALKQFKESIVKMYDTNGSKGMLGGMMRGFLMDSTMDINKVKDLSNEAFFTTVYASMMKNLGVFKSMMSEMKTEVIGHVADGNDLAYVVCRMKMEMMGMSTEQMQVVTVKRDGNDWKIMTGGSMDGLSSVMNGSH